MGDATTTDAIFGGALRLAQPARGRGYRFNVDALLLAREALEGGASGRALDLGAGCGVVGLSLRLLGGLGGVLAERDPWMASLAARNAAPWPDVAVRTCEAAELTDPERFSLVVSNPPYTAPDEGRPCPEPRRARARSGELRPFVEAAARLLRVDGRALFVYPAQALASLLAEAACAGLCAGDIRMVHPHPSAPARVALLWLRRGAGPPARALAPWFERDERGQPDEAIARFLRGP